MTNETKNALILGLCGIGAYLLYRRYVSSAGMNTNALPYPMYTGAILPGATRPIPTGRTQTDPSGSGEVISEMLWPDGQITWPVTTPASR